MPALQTQMETITLEQYEALPENRRVEVFESVVYDMANPLISLTGNDAMELLILLLKSFLLATHLMTISKKHSTTRILV